MVQADTLVPTGVQGYDRFAYANNNPLVYSDPTGHYVCEGTDVCTPSESQGGGWRRKHEQSKGAGSGLATPQTSISYGGLDFAGYSDREIRILQFLYNNGGPDAVHGVQFMVEHSIHIQWGQQFQVYAPNPNGDTYSGDWQSMFDVGAWFDDKIVYLAPSVSRANILKDAFALQNIIHEALHIEQGYWLSHSWEGERLAWRTGARV